MSGSFALLTRQSDTRGKEVPPVKTAVGPTRRRGCVATKTVSGVEKPQTDAQTAVSEKPAIHTEWDSALA